MSSLIKDTLTISEPQKPVSVLIAEQTIAVTWADSLLTDDGYIGVEAILAGLGYGWSNAYQFIYSLTYNTGTLLDVPNGWNVTFYSTFSNGLIPAPLWIRDSWVTIPYGFDDTKTIPAHYETQTPAPVETVTQNLGWNSSALSKKVFRGDGVAMFRLDSANTGSVCGFNKTGEGFASDYASIAYGIKSAGNQYQIVEYGTTKTTAASFASADIFTITITSNVVEYWINGDLVYASEDDVNPTDYWLLDCSLYEAGDAIYDAFIADTADGYGNGFTDVITIDTRDLTTNLALGLAIKKTFALVNRFLEKSEIIINSSFREKQQISLLNSLPNRGKTQIILKNALSDTLKKQIILRNSLPNNPLQSYSKIQLVFINSLPNDTTTVIN